MGLYSFVLFAAIVLLACVGSASKVAAANSTAQGRWDAEEQNGASTKSFVRPSEPTDEGDEARGLFGNMLTFHMLESESTRLKGNLAIVVKDALKKFQAVDDAAALYTSSYLLGPEGALLAKIASEYREMSPQLHDTFLSNLLKELAVTPDEEVILVGGLNLARNSGNMEIKTLATKLLELSKREKIPLGRSFKLRTGEDVSSMDKSLVAYLSDTYGDAEVTEMLIQLQNVGDRQALAVRLQKEQLERWQSGHKSVADVIKLMKVEDNEYLFDKLDLLVRYYKLRQLKQTAEHSPGGLTIANKDDLDDLLPVISEISRWSHKFKKEQIKHLKQDIPSP